MTGLIAAYRGRMLLVSEIVSQEEGAEWLLGLAVSEMRFLGCVGVVFVVSVVCGVHGSNTDNSEIEGDVNDLLEMVPFDQLAALFFEYLSTDAQINKVLHYLTGEKFKSNLVQFETSAAFHEAYDSLLPLGVDIYSWTNELNRLLDIATIRPRWVLRRRRSPGDGLGVYGLVKDALTLLPIQDIKEAYNHKLDTNPAFENMMDRLLTVELRNHIYTLMSTEEFEQTTRELADLGVAVSDIVDLLEDQIVNFFDLDSKEEDDDEDE